MENKNDVVNRQLVQFNIRNEPRELGHEESQIHDNRRNNWRNFNTNDSEPVEIRKMLNQNRTRRSTIRNRSTRHSRVHLYNREIEDDSDQSDNNYTISITHFPFGTTQTPF